MINHNKKYNALRVRMTPLELEFLDEFCKKKKQSRAKIVRIQKSAVGMAIGIKILIITEIIIIR